MAIKGQPSRKPTKPIGYVGRFGLKVIAKPVLKSGHMHRFYKCMCPHCGSDAVIPSSRIDINKSCGCLADNAAVAKKKYAKMNGARYGSLTIAGMDEYNGGKTMMRVRCDCGNAKSVSIDSMKSGNTTTCGECNKRKWIGERFNMLEVLAFAGFDKRRQVQVHCICDCGQFTTVNIGSLKRGQVSCGCHKGKPAGYKKSGRIYMLKNWMGHIIYVGQTINKLSVRLSGHWKTRGSSRIATHKLGVYLRKIEHKPSIHILEDEVPASRLNEREGYWMKVLKPPLNTQPAAAT